MAGDILQTTLQVEGIRCNCLQLSLLKITKVAVDALLPLGGSWYLLGGEGGGGFTPKPW